MIPYELILPSASRPHLLGPVLTTLLAHADQLPERILVHNDERFPGRREQIDAAVAKAVAPYGLPVWLEHHNPPIKHGPALYWLLSHVQTEYVLYSQDDHQVKRPLPVRDALTLLHQHHLNQIRFNKRDTMDKKGREGAEFHKVEFPFTLPDRAPCSCPCHRGEAIQHQVAACCTQRMVPLCAADHWYFQTGVWRVAAIKPVVDWWAGPGAEFGAFDEHMEVKINQVFNGEWRGKHPSFPSSVPCLAPGLSWCNPMVRAAVHKTFIWGRVGEPQFVEHIGDKPEDWALERGNRDPQAVRAAKGQP